LFDWLVSEGRGEIKVNPFNGLHQKTLKGKNPRPPFTVQQLVRCQSRFCRLSILFQQDLTSSSSASQNMTQWTFQSFPPKGLAKEANLAKNKAGKA
jgi:hypothetical protein